MFLLVIAKDKCEIKIAVYPEHIEISDVNLFLILRDFSNFVGLMDFR